MVVQVFSTLPDRLVRQTFLPCQYGAGGSSISLSEITNVLLSGA